MIVSPRTLTALSSLGLCCLLLLTAAARGEDVVDSPMYRDPELPVPKLVKTFSDRLPALWIEALGRPEADFRSQAALTIAEAREAGMTGLEITIPVLIRELERADQHPSVRLATARALVALDAKTAAPALLKACLADEWDLREIAEPALARWAYAPAAEEWLKRIGQPPQRRGTILAIQGLVTMKVEKAVPRLRELVLARGTAPSIRLEAARALGIIRTSGAEADADTLTADATPRGIIDRLAAVSLLRHHSGDEAARRLQKFMGDTEPSVAAIAGARLMEIDAKLVIPLLPTVLASTDAPVRAFGVETLLRHPTDDHIKLLGDRLSDAHPDVRAQARRALRELAGKAEFKPAVLREGDRALAGRDWRGREQAALLFGQLAHKPAADRLVQALQDVRGEVGVAAAWALRKLAAPETFAAVLDYVRANTRSGDNPARRKISAELLDGQLSQLIQLLGVVRYHQADSALRPMIPPTAPAGFETRAAACWALGLLHEGKATSELSRAFAGRVAAVFPGDIEDNRVRWTSAISVGRMKGKDYLHVIRKFYADQVSLDSVNNACGWAIEQITGERLPAPVDIILPQRLWFLVTID